MFEARLYFLKYVKTQEEEEIGINKNIQRIHYQSVQADQ